MILEDDLGSVIYMDEFLKEKLLFQLGIGCFGDAAYHCGKFYVHCYDDKLYVVDALTHKVEWFRNIVLYARYSAFVVMFDWCLFVDEEQNLHGLNLVTLEEREYQI